MHPKNRCTSLVLQRVVPKWHEITAFNRLSHIQLPPPSTITTHCIPSSRVNRFRKKSSKRLQSHVLSTVNKMRTNPSNNLFGFGPMLAIRLLWTGPQSLHVNSPRPHSLYPRGGWNFQLSLARCIRKKPLMLAAGYLVGFRRAKKTSRS